MADVANDDGLRSHPGMGRLRIVSTAVFDSGSVDRTVLHTPRREQVMGAQQNKQTARDAYAAFSKGDADGAMRNIDDSIEWTVRGDNALSGVHTGKQQVGKLWAEYMSKNLTTEPHDFIADGDKVVVLTTVELEGEQIENADVLTYNGDGMLVAFDTLGDEALPNRVFARS
jgi:ketosteroid isomerase-like protein